MTGLPAIAQVDAERLGYAIAARAERLLVGDVAEPYYVDLIDPHDGSVVGHIPAADPEAACSIAASLRFAGWGTRCEVLP